LKKLNVAPPRAKGKELRLYTVAAKVVDVKAELKKGL